MKGVAVPYLVAIILGIIVLAIIVYLVYFHIIVKGPLDCPECGARFTHWCSKCYLLNPDAEEWGGENKMDDDLEECVGRCGLFSPQDICNEAMDACKGVGVPP